MFLLTMAFVVSLAANTNKTLYAATPGLSGEKYVLENLIFVPDSDGAVSIDGTNYITVTVKNGSTSLGSFTTTTGGTALVAGTAVVFSLSGAALQFSAGDIVTLDSVKTGTGAVLKGTFTGTFRQIHA